MAKKESGAIVTVRNGQAVESWTRFKSRLLDRNLRAYIIWKALNGIDIASRLRGQEFSETVLAAERVSHKGGLSRLARDVSHMAHRAVVEKGYDAILSWRYEFGVSFMLLRVNLVRREVPLKKPEEAVCEKSVPTNSYPRLVKRNGRADL